MTPTRTGATWSTPSWSEHPSRFEHAGDHPDTATTATTATDDLARSLRCSSEPMLPDVSALPYAADS